MTSAPVRYDDMLSQKELHIALRALLWRSVEVEPAPNANAADHVTIHLHRPGPYRIDAVDDDSLTISAPGGFSAHFPLSAVAIRRS